MARQAARPVRGPRGERVTRAGPGPPWRLVLGLGGADPLGDLAGDGASNMAIDDALLASVAAGAPPVLRLYRWQPACLSLGRNQATRGRLDRAGLERVGWHVVRRPTGGLAVLHAEEITYAVAARVETIGRPRDAYARISGALAAALRSLGLEARVVGGSDGDRQGMGGAGGGAGGADPAALARHQAGAPHPSSREPRCFTGTAPGEVCVGGRKILGSAQRRSGRALLQHGSLLLGGSQDAVAGLFGGGAPDVAAASSRACHDGEPAAAGSHGVAAPPAREGSNAPTPPSTTVARELGHVPADERIVAEIVAAFGALVGEPPEPSGLAAAERDLAAGAAARYSSEAWTWRR